MLLEEFCGKVFGSGEGFPACGTAAVTLAEPDYFPFTRAVVPGDFFSNLNGSKGDEIINSVFVGFDSTIGFTGVVRKKKWLIGDDMHVDIHLNRGPASRGRVADGFACDDQLADTKVFFTKDGAALFRDFPNGHTGMICFT